MDEEPYEDEKSLFFGLLEAGNVEISPIARELINRSMCNRSDPDDGMGTQLQVLSEALYHIRGKIADNIQDCVGTSGTLADRTPKSDDFVDGVDRRSPGEIAVDQMPVFSAENQIVALGEIDDMVLRLQEFLPKMQDMDSNKAKRHQIDKATKSVTGTINQLQQLQLRPMQEIAEDVARCAKEYDAVAEKYGDVLGGINLALIRDATSLCRLMGSRVEAYLEAHRANFRSVV